MAGFESVCVAAVQATPVILDADRALDGLGFHFGPLQHRRHVLGLGRVAVTVGDAVVVVGRIRRRKGDASATAH